MRTPAGTIVAREGGDVKSMTTDHTKLDPYCRFSTFCEAQPWELQLVPCEMCPDHSRLVDDRAHSAEPEMSDGKVVLLASLGIGDLRRRANDLLPKLAATRAQVVGRRGHIRELTEKVDEEEAGLILSEAFKELKNDASRKAWLAAMRTDDPGYALALAARERAQRELEASEVALEVHSEELRVILAEMRLVSAQLAFLAGGD